MHRDRLAIYGDFLQREAKVSASSRPAWCQLWTGGSGRRRLGMVRAGDAAPAATSSQITFGCNFRAHGGGQEMLRGRSIPMGMCSGTVLVDTVVSLFTEKMPFCTRKAAGFEVGPEQGQPGKRGSGPQNAAQARHQRLAGSQAVCPLQQTFLVCLPNAKHSENALNTNACLVGDGSDYTQGTGGSSPTHGFAGKYPADGTRTRDHVHCEVCFNPRLSPQKPHCLA